MGMIENKTAYGIVLDGEVAVGKFVFITEEDKSGQRQVMKLDLNQMYVDITNGKTRKYLKCILVEDIPENEIKNVPSEMKNPLCVKILADLGIGMFQGKVILDSEQAHYQKAVFSKLQPKLNPKLN